MPSHVCEFVKNILFIDAIERNDGSWKETELGKMKGK
jgi:hypothetical protein